MKPTVKVGLSAPFEGRYRDLGYEVLYAVRLAIQQRNQAGGVGDRYLVELVALNDFNEAEEAILQARKMAVDPGVMGVLGGWAPETVKSAMPEYARLGLPFLVPVEDYTRPRPAPPMPAGLAPGYQALSGGTPPGPAAAWAYAETARLLDALDVVIREEGSPRRQDVQRALTAGQ